MEKLTQEDIDVQIRRRSRIDHDVAAVEFCNVSKVYQIQQRAAPRFGSWFVSKLFEYLKREPFHALSDVSFRVSRGEMVGFVGANGAGKSTILKLVAGITQPTSGSIHVNGRVTSMLELGVGFHPELTGMENIFYNGALLGMPRQKLLEKLQEIIEFSGLRKFIYEPVKHYSSGMYARLACSVAFHLDSEILLVDEILAVGDAEFQQRGMMKVLELHEKGTTIVLVTHETATARDLCDRLLWVDHGIVKMTGASRDVSQAYLKFMSQRSILPTHFLAPTQAIVANGDEAELREKKLDEYIGKSVPRFRNVRLENAEGESVDSVRTGDPCRFVFDLDENGVEIPYRLAICIRWRDGQGLFEDQTEMLAPGENPQVVYDVPNWPMLRAEMSLSAALITDDEPPVVLDRAEDTLTFRTLTDLPFTETAIAPPTNWTLHRID
ncbi:ABC transporter ATP-binding protein [bacterium]|nr:ABC transporter ATP-binding protein [bacterium]